jgi:DNA polymerase-3 subunit gamma/tau
VSGEHGKELSAAAGKVGLENILAAMQILDQALSRLRYSTQGRILAELALVRIASLGDLTELSEIIGVLKSGSALPEGIGSPPLPAPSGESGDAKKKAELAPPPASGQIPDGQAPGPDPDEAVMALTRENATEIWTRAAARIPGLVGEHARHFDRVATPAPNRLVVGFRQEYTFSKSICETPEQKGKLERALAELTGQRLQLEFEVVAQESAGGDAPSAPRSNLGGQRRAQVAQHPMVQRAMELFGAFPERVDNPASE